MEHVTTAGERVWDDIDEAVDAGDHDRALDRALSAWRARRHAPIADLVDVLGSKALGAAVVANGSKAFQAAWLDRAAKTSPSRIGALLVTLTRSIPMPQRYFWHEGTAAERYAAWFARLDALAALPDDPRVAAALFDVVRRAPWSSYYASDTAAAYDPALRLIERIGDDRLLEPMRALVETPTASRQTTRRYLSGALPGVVAALEDTQRRKSPLPTAELERCERVIERLGGRLQRTGTSGSRARDEDETALVELVIANPDDDDPREVLGDFWLERQDPRGELVTLQLKVSRGAATAADEKVIRTLIREHEKTWLEDVALVTKKRVFRRGFLDEIELQQNAAADPKVWERVPLDPRLATVRTIRKGKANEAHYRRFVLSPTVRSLRDLTVVSKGMLKDVCERSEPWPIEHLELAFMPDKKTLGAVARSPAFPALTKLTAGVTRGSVEKLLPLVAAFTKVRPLDRITVTPLRWYDELEGLATWLAAARTTLAHVPELGIDFPTSQEHRMSARRGERGLRLELVGTHLFFLSRISWVLLKEPGVEHIHLRVPEGHGEVLHGEEHEARRLLTALPSGLVELDPAWTAAVEAPPRPGPPRHRDA